MKKYILTLFLGIGLGFSWIYYGFNFRLGVVTELFGIVATVFLIEDYLRKQEEQRVEQKNLPVVLQTVEEYNSNLVGIYNWLQELFEKVAPHEEDEYTSISQNAPSVININDHLEKLDDLVNNFSNYLAPELHIRLSNYHRLLQYQFNIILSNKPAGYLLDYIIRMSDDIMEFSTHLSHSTNTPIYIAVRKESEIIASYYRGKDKKLEQA